MRKKYSLLGLIKEATEPDKKHSGKGKGLAVMVDGSKASDNSGALKAKTDGGGDVMLKAALKTLGSAYSGEYYVWTKAGDQPTVKPLGKYYKKGSGDPYTYDSLGETESGKRKYRVISGPVNGGTYKSGKFKGKKIGTRPIGAIFTMGKELDPVPDPVPTPVVESETIDLRIIDRLEKILAFTEAFDAEINPRSGTLSANIASAFKYMNKFNDGSRGSDEIEDLLNKAKAFKAMENANVDPAEFKGFLESISLSNKRMKQYEYTAKQAMSPLPSLKGSDLPSKAQIAIGSMKGLHKVYGQYYSKQDAKVTVDGGSGGSQLQSESLSRGSLYRRRYWGRY